jgi:hypothetical protein
VSALLIDDSVRAQLAALAAHALAHPVTAAQMQLLARGRVRPAGDDPAFVRDLPVNYRVVLSVEEHPQPAGGTVWLRHLSVSLRGTRKGRVPPEPAVRELLLLTGFRQPLEECAVWTEDFGEGIAVNVVGRLEPAKGE